MRKAIVGPEPLVARRFETTVAEYHLKLLGGPVPVLNYFGVSDGLIC